MFQRELHSQDCPSITQLWVDEFTLFTGDWYVNVATEADTYQQLSVWGLQLRTDPFFIRIHGSELSEH